MGFRNRLAACIAEMIFNSTLRPSEEFAHEQRAEFGLSEHEEIDPRGSGSNLNIF
jgi:hypothetical protein